MAPSQLALFSELDLTWMDHLAAEVSFMNGVFGEMRDEGLDLSDVISALETGNPLTVAKENTHDAFFSMVGTTCDGDLVKVVVSMSPHKHGICVHHVCRI